VCVQTCNDDSAKQFVLTVLTYQELCMKKEELKSETLKIRPILSVRIRPIVFYVYLDINFKSCDESWIVTKIVENFDIFP
jgi:hypothetical protein